MNYKKSLAGHLARPNKSFFCPAALKRLTESAMYAKESQSETRTYVCTRSHPDKMDFQFATLSLSSLSFFLPSLSLSLSFSFHPFECALKHAELFFISCPNTFLSCCGCCYFTACSIVYVFFFTKELDFFYYPSLLT